MTQTTIITNLNIILLDILVVEILVSRLDLTVALVKFGLVRDDASGLSDAIDHAVRSLAESVRQVTDDISMDGGSQYHNSQANKGNLGDSHFDQKFQKMRFKEEKCAKLDKVRCFGRRM